MNGWYDRVTGRYVEELPNTVITGRFLVGNTSTFNGHTTIEKGGFLLNDGTDKFHIDHEIGCFTKCGKKGEDATEFDIIESTILAYQEAIDAGNKSSFLIPDKLLARFELLKFEELLFNVLKKGHLQEIARRPRMELIYEEYLVPVSRAKKIASSANTHLASHSECWQTRTLTGVIPKKVLALESEDQLNIYENRVFVKLLGYIEQYLIKRISEVKKLEELFKEAMNFQEAEDIYFELRESIFKLWGEGFSDNTEADDAASNGITTLNILTMILKKVRTLQQSKLYQLLSHNLHVPLKLNMTNVLSHDQHYRHAARLWNGWLETQQVNKVEPEYVYTRNQKLTNAYTRYCSDLVKRTLHELNFKEPSSNHFVRNGTKPIRFSITENSEIFLTRENKSLCFVPCFTENIINTETKDDNGIQRVLLSLRREKSIDNKVVCSSPTNFYSLELLASLISKWLAKETYKSLHSEVNKIPTSLINELKKINNDHWAIHENNMFVSKPFMSLVPTISSLITKNDRDVTIKKSVEKIISMAEDFEHFLCCPCCGVKVSENQWLSREHGCFAINRSGCNHMWEVSPKTDGSKYLLISPNKFDKPNNDNTFEKIGRYSMKIEI